MEHLQFEEMGYLLSKPQDKAGPFPTLLLLHGAGSRGRQCAPYDVGTYRP